MFTPLDPDNPNFTRGDIIWKGVKDGIARGATNVGLEWAAQEAGLDPLEGALASRGIIGLIDGALNPVKTSTAAIFEAFKDSTFNFITAGGSGDDLYTQSAYMAKVLDFSKIINDKGIEEALETYAAAIFQQDAIESIYSQGGIADILTNNARYTKIKGIEVKEIDINNNYKIYLGIVTDEFKGRRINNKYLEFGSYGLGDDGQFKLIKGSAETDLADGFKMILKIENGARIAYSVIGKDSQEQLTITDAVYDKQGNLQSAAIENKITGVKMVIRDGKISLSIPMDGVEDTYLLKDEDIKYVSPESIFTTVAYLISNGINNQGTGAPSYAKGWAQDFAAAGIDSDSVFIDAAYENGNKARDLGLWALDVLFGADIITNDLIAKANTKFLTQGGLPKGDDRLVLAYSGTGNPWIKALNRVDYGVSTFMAIGAPRRFFFASSFNDTNPIKRTILITGEYDKVGLIGAGGKPFKNVETQYNIILEGVGHMYGYDPKNPPAPGSKEYIRVKTSRFVAELASRHNDDERLEEYLNDPAVNFDIESKVYRINLQNFNLDKD